MTRELFGFFAPPRKLSQSVLISAGISLVLMVLHLDSLAMAALAIWFGWSFSGSFAHIVIQPFSSWDRAWPVSDRLLLRTRLIAAWLAGWVPALGPLIAASALHALGVVTDMTWARCAFHALCILGLVPFANALSYRLSDLPQGSPGNVAALVLLPTVVLDVLGTASGVVGSSSVSGLLGLAVIVGALTGSGGLLLTRAWVRPSRLESSAARSRASAAGTSSLLGVRRAPLVWLFFLQSRWQGVAAWVYLAIAAGLASFFRLPALMWYLGTSFWFQAYSGSSQPGPLPAYLPIARRRVLGYMLAPLAVFMLSGLAFEQVSPYQTSGLTVGFYAEELSRQGFKNPDKLYRLVVPSFSWRVSWGEPPPVTSPEGVSRRPTAFALLPGSRLNVYNPYDARLDDDPAFVNYQVSRIMSEEWHMNVSVADVERACGAVKRGRMPVWCVNGELATKYQRPRAWPAVECWLLCIMTLLMLQTQLAGRRSRRKARRWGSRLWFVPLIMLPMVIDQVGKNDPTGLLSFAFRGGVLLGELTRLVERSPLVSSALGLALLLGAYRYVERCFMHMESHTAPWGRQRFAR